MNVLVVVDMQNDFITGPLGTPEARAIVPKVKEKIEQAVANGDYIFFTKDTHFGDYLKTKEGEKLPVEHCIYQSSGWDIHKELLNPVTNYRRHYLHDKFTFGSNKLVEEIRWQTDNAFTEIEIVGVCTDICVISNALILKSHYYQNHDISVDAVCCAGTTPEMHEAALKIMESCQINVKR